MLETSSSKCKKSSKFFCKPDITFKDVFLGVWFYCYISLDSHYGFICLYVWELRSQSFSKGIFYCPMLSLTPLLHVSMLQRYLFCQFHKGSSLVFVRLKDGYHTSLNTEASAGVTSYLFCIIYDPICKILVGPAALDISLGLIW